MAQVGTNHIEGKDEFTIATESVRAIKEKYVDPRIQWYRTHTSIPRWMFRLSGISTILLSVTLPALATATFRHKELCLSIVSIAVAMLTGLSSFFRWERTWRGNSTAQVALEQHVAKWELELTNARLVLASDKRMAHVYAITDDLLNNARSVVSSEAEGFFSALQFPQQNSAPR